MAQRSFLADDLVTSVRLQCQLPGTSASDNPTNAQILALLDEELRGYLVPNLVSVAGHYLERSEDTTLTSETSYRIPSRAVGGRLHGAFVVDSGGYRSPLPIVDQIEPMSQNGAPDGLCAYVQNHRLFLNQVPTAGNTLRMVYYTQPGQLCTVTDARRITARASLVLTLASTVPTEWSGTASQRYDVVRSEPGFENLVQDAISSPSGTSATLSSVNSADDVTQITTGAVYGDWMVLAGFSPVPQIPSELHPVLVQRGCSRVLKLLGDANGAQMVLDTARSLEEQAYRILSPRVANTHNKIVPTFYRRPWF